MDELTRKGFSGEEAAHWRWWDQLSPDSRTEVRGPRWNPELHAQRQTDTQRDRTWWSTACGGQRSREGVMARGEEGIKERRPNHRDELRKSDGEENPR